MQTIVTDVRGVCPSVCLSHAVELCAVHSCSLCQITLASCLKKWMVQYNFEHLLLNSIPLKWSAAAGGLDLSGQLASFSALKLLVWSSDL